MRWIRLISAGLLLFVSAPAFAQDFSQEWIEFVDRKEHFEINFPGQPTVKDIEYKAESGDMVPAKVYTAKDGPAVYTLTVVNFKDAEQGDYRGSTAWAAWQFRKRGGEVTLDAYQQTDRIAGMQLQITNPDKTRSYIGIFPHMRRLYIMEATAPPDYPPPSDFPQTISILDDQGRRVRYELDDEGNRTGQDEDGRRLYENVQ
jgi:hypothetical protein